MILENTDEKVNDSERVERRNRSSLDRPASSTIDLSHLFVSENQQRDVALDQQESYRFEFSPLSPTAELQEERGGDEEEEEDSVDMDDVQYTTADMASLDRSNNAGKISITLFILLLMSPFVYVYWRIFNKENVEGSCLQQEWSSSTSLVMETLFQHCDCVSTWMEEEVYFDPVIIFFVSMFIVVAFLFIRRVKSIVYHCWRWCWISTPELETAMYRYHGLAESNRTAIMGELRRKFPAVPNILRSGTSSNVLCVKPGIEWLEWFSMLNQRGKGDLLGEIISRMAKFPSNQADFWVKLEEDWGSIYEDMPGIFDGIETSKNVEVSSSAEMVKLAGVEFCKWLDNETTGKKFEEEFLYLVELNERSIHEDADQTDMTVFFVLLLLLAVGVLVDYTAIQTWPSGGLMCRWVYFSSSVLYKPFMVPMCFCTSFSCHYTFSDQYFGDLHRDESGSPLGAPFRRSRLTVFLVGGVSVLQLLWLIPTLPIILPLMVVFLPVVVLPAVIFPLLCVHLLPKLLDKVGTIVSLQFRYFALKVVEHDGMNLETLPNRMRADKVVVLAAVKNSGKALRYALGRLKEDKELLMLAMASDSSILEFAQTELLSDFNFAFEAVSIDGLALRYLGEELKYDAEIVSMAVMQNGLSLQYAPGSVRDKKKVALYAVEQCGLALEFVSDRLKDDAEVVRAALNQDKNAQKFSTVLSTRSSMEAVFKNDFFKTHSQPSPSEELVSPDIQEESTRVNIESFSDSIVALQGSAIQLVSIVILCFVFLPFYKKGFDWWVHGAARFLSANYHLSAKQWNQFFSWPDFDQLKLNVQFALGLMLVGSFVVQRYSKRMLSAVQPYNNMSALTPGRLESKLMLTFSNLTWRPLRESVEVLITMIEQVHCFRKHEKEGHRSHWSYSLRQVLHTCCKSRLKVFRDGANDADVISFTESDEATSYRKVKFAEGNGASVKALGVISMRCPWISISSVSFSNIRGDLHNFCTIKTLYHLDLSRCTHLTGDLLSIRTLRLLTFLNLSYCPHIDGELNSVAALTLLTHVNLAHCEQITGDIGDLAPLTKIKYIHLTGSPKVTVLWKGLEHNSTAVTRLLEAGVYQNSITSHGFSPLHGAAVSGYVDIVAAIVDLQGGFVDSTELLHKHTPLHCAASNGRLAVVLCLIKRGANVSMADTENMTALHFAIEGGHIEIVESLIENGADMNAENKDKATPLHLGALNGHHDSVALLLDKGADPTAQDHKQWTGLHHAARYGHTSAAKLFLDKVDVNITDKRNWTALHLAARYGHHITAAMLVGEGADIHCMSINGSSPLHFASANGHVSTVAKLIALGADREAFDKQKWTPAHHAAFNHHDVVVALLHDASSNPYIDIQEEIRSRPRPTLDTHASLIDVQKAKPAPRGRTRAGMERKPSQEKLRSKSTPRPLIGRELSQNKEGELRAASVSRTRSRPELIKTPSNLKDGAGNKSVRPSPLSKGRSQLSFSKIPGSLRNHSQAYAGYGAAI